MTVDGFNLVDLSDKELGDELKRRGFSIGPVGRKIPFANFSLLEDGVHIIQQIGDMIKGCLFISIVRMI